MFSQLYIDAHKHTHTHTLNALPTQAPKVPEWSPTYESVHVDAGVRLEGKFSNDGKRASSASLYTGEATQGVASCK